jgi:hypothetical protein
MLKKLSSRELVFFIFLSLFLIFMMHSSAIAKARGGEEPQCQEECLATHAMKMKLLLGEYAKRGDKMKYQDAVEDEASRYARCLTNCRELIPVK